MSRGIAWLWLYCKPNPCKWILRLKWADISWRRTQGYFLPCWGVVRELSATLLLYLTWDIAPQSWGYRRSGAEFLWMELQLTQHIFSSEQTHTFNDNKMWLRKTRSEQKHIPPLSLQISLQSSVLTSRALWQASKTLWPRLLTRWDLTWN